MTDLLGLENLHEERSQQELDQVDERRGDEDEDDIEGEESDAMDANFDFEKAKIGYPKQERRTS